MDLTKIENLKIEHKKFKKLLECLSNDKKRLENIFFGNTTVYNIPKKFDNFFKWNKEKLSEFYGIKSKNVYVHNSNFFNL